MGTDHPKCHMDLVLKVHRLVPRSHSVEAWCLRSMVLRAPMNDRKYLLNSRKPPIRQSLLMMR